MDDDNIPVEQRHYSRIPLTRTVKFSVAMRTEIETLQKPPGMAPGQSAFEINATVSLRQSDGSVPVRYELTGTLTPREPREQELSGTTKNLSQGGLCIVTNFGLQEHQVVRIGMPVPESELTTPTLAEVRWLEAQGGAVRAGLKYLL